MQKGLWQGVLVSREKVVMIEIDFEKEKSDFVSIERQRVDYDYRSLESS